MNLFICTFFLISVYLSISGYINFYVNKFKNDDSFNYQNICWSLSFGFIITLTSISSANIILHLFGFTLKSSLILLPISILFFNFNFFKIKKLALLIYLKINNIFKDIYHNKDPILIILYILIAIQIFCLFIRFLLPVTHGDAISQYFYDSLQISRLDSISISQYYEIGEYFRTDSLASFFDAFILQITDNWFLVRTLRLIALILVLFSSLELASNIGKINYKRSILLLAIILTLPDIWDISLSGKHDGYVLLFELTGIYTIAISLFSKLNYLKFLFAFIALFIGFVSIGIRLSSLSFFLISLSLLIYYVFKSLLDLKINNLEKVTLKLPYLTLFYFFAIIISTFTFAYFNYKYYSNPFYWVSPPGALKIFFPNEVHAINYEWIKETLSLRNIDSLIKPLLTFIYASLGLEPIRFGLNKFKETNEIFRTFSNILNFIGPQEMMVSILSFSPFTLLPFFGLKGLKDYRKRILLILISIWILLWALSVPYTRVALASSLSLVIFAFSGNNLFRKTLQKNNLFSLLRSSLIYYGLISIILFTAWSFSYLYDLPLKSLIKSDFYSRTNLTREYIKKQDKILGKKSLIPDKKFEENWKKIEDNNKGSHIFLLRTPKIYSYFTKKGTIISNTKNLYKIPKQKKCYQINSENMIIDLEC